MNKSIFCIVSIMLSILDFVFPCSAIVLKHENQILLAKNFDWTYGEGMIVKNLQGTHKFAYYTHTGEQAEWISLYGSITFNQNGKEMPYGGMNEKGLVVEMLWLETTRYNMSEAKMYVNELEWIQYQLDNFESVQQVLAHLNDLKIYPIKGKIHYIITDAAGESVIIEYLHGQPAAYKKDANTCQAITNHSVLQSEPYKSQINGIRRNNTAPTYRYYQLEQQILTLDQLRDINETFAFASLKKVAIPKGDFRTRWSIVYNINQKSISFFTDTHKSIKTINLSELDLDQQLTYYPLNQNEIQQLSKVLKPLTEPINHSFLSPSLQHLDFEEQIPLDLSRHQFSENKTSSSAFADHCFHFEISIPFEAEKQTGFIAVMDSEQNFYKKQAVTGGYLYGTIGAGTLMVHIYGLKNGTYSMLAFIDSIKNKKLDFDKEGKALEKYATFSDKTLGSERELNFLHTSAEFSSSNAKVIVQWK